MKKLGHYLLGPNDENQGIYTGDARELARAIPDESVDLIFTDPPYPKEFLWTFAWTAEVATRVLKVGGSCMVMTGMQYFDTIFPAFCENLNYYWLNAYYMPTVTQSLRFWPKRIFNMWKPVLWFVKGERKASNFVPDGVSSLVSDKRFHKWGQSAYWALHWIEKITQKDSVVIDPFTGGGTVPAVCKMLDRRYLAFEIDSEVAELARERVRNTQPPLFVPQPQQAEMGVMV